MDLPVIAASLRLPEGGPVRPGVRVEDERGNPVSFFQLKEMAKLEAGNEKA
jgi:hypothetical protein